MKRRLRIKHTRIWWENFTQAWKSIGWWYSEYTYYKRIGYDVVLTDRGLVVYHPLSVSYSEGI